MQKQALESKVDPATVGRFALGGLITGGATMSLVNLVRMVKAQIKERKALTHPTETTEDTIVLTLPSKQGQESTDEDEERDGSDLIKETVSSSSSTVKGPRTTSQYRRSTDGTFGFKTAANWQTLTAATLATMGSAAAGVYVMNRIYQMQKEKLLKDKVDAARSEYLNMLDQNKVASTILDSIIDAPLQKSADATGSPFGMLNYPLAAAALLSILGAGGVGFITKRILDEQSQQSSEKGLDLPKVKRIVFKSRPSPTNAKSGVESEDPTVQGGADMTLNKEKATKQASDEEPLTVEDLDCIKAALAVHLDLQDTHTRIMSDSDVVVAMKTAGTSPMKLFKMAQAADPTSFDKMMSYFKSNPQLRQLMIRAAMAKHKVYKHFTGMSNWPIAKQVAERKLYDTLGKQFGPTPVKAPVKTAAAGLATQLGGMGMQANILGSIVGSTLAQKNQSKEIARDLMDAQKEIQIEEANQKNPKEVAQDIQIVAKDPKAKAYLAANKEKVRALVTRLVAQGKI